MRSSSTECLPSSSGGTTAPQDFELGPTDRAEIALLANPDHPAAVRAVRRVANRRIAYIAGQLEKLGRDPDEALDRAVVLYYVYIGYLQMAHVAPDVIKRGRPGPAARAGVQRSPHR